MKTMILGGIVVGGLILIAKPPPANYGDFELDYRPIHRLIGFMFAPGDTLNYGARWPRWRGATSYIYSVRASTTGWTVPTDVATTDTFATLRLSNLAVWDSVTFRLVVKGRNSFGTSRDSAYVSWKVVRQLVSPGPPVIDSSQVIAALVLRPEDVILAGGESVQFCVFFFMLNGKYYTHNLQPSNEIECKRQYDLLPVEGQLPGYPPAAISFRSPYKEFRIVIEPTGKVSVQLAMM